MTNYRVCTDTHDSNTEIQDKNKKEFRKIYKLGLLTIELEVLTISVYVYRLHFRLEHLNGIVKWH